MSNSQNPDNPFSTGHGGGQQIPEPPRDQPAFSARVPEKIGRGAYSPGQVVLDGPREFVIDFLQGLTRPYQVTARVVLAPETFYDLITTLQTNLDHYTRNFGAPPPLPVPNPPQRPTLQEVYDHFKLPDELLSGAYANQVMIGHSATDFAFDFITSFYPTSAVSSRVYVPAAVVPKFLTSLRATADQHRERMKLLAQQQQQQNPNQPPPSPDSGPTPDRS